MSVLKAVWRNAGRPGFGEALSAIRSKNADMSNYINLGGGIRDIANARAHIAMANHELPNSGHIRDSTGFRAPNNSRLPYPRYAMSNGRRMSGHTRGGFDTL